jgi:hypothetical protein
VLVERATDELAHALPAELGGYGVEVRETGTIEALDG